MNRRKFMTCTAVGTLAGGLLSTSLGRMALAAGGHHRPIRAIAFDAFPIFDPRAAFKTIQEQFPEEGDALRKEWFGKIFSYTWLRTSGMKYKDFWQVMRDALAAASRGAGLEMTRDKEDAIMNTFLSLPVWPDVLPALERMGKEGLRLGFLSNMTEDMLRANMRHNGIEAHFEKVLSTDLAQAFKPSPAAYQLGVDAFGVEKNEIAFAAFAGWDAVGARWFGYPSVWINRLDFPAENLDAAPDASGKDLKTLTDFVLP